jgi:hypothetical protein
MENEELIRRQMVDTRESLTEKLETLEEKVSDTVAAVKETVSSAKEVVDLKVQVQRHPWLMFGGAVACGIVVENILMRRSEESATSSSRLSGQGWFGAFEPELRNLRGLALGTLFGTVREMVSGHVPPHMAHRLRNILDAATRKAGGEPIPPTDWSQAQSRVQE